MNTQHEHIEDIPWQVQRFNELIKNKQSVYFDVEDFEEIIDYHVSRSDYKESLKVAEYACKLHPSSIALMLKRAQLLASVNKENHALELLTVVETLEPNNFEIYLTKGAIYSQLRNYEKAIEEYSKAAVDSDEPDYVYCNIAFEYENMGNFEKTIEYLTKALELNPDNDLAIYEAAYCFDLLSLNQESIDFFVKLIDRHPFSVEGWFNLGLSYVNAELYEKALESFDLALAIDPEHNSSVFHTGYTYSLLGKYKDAIDVYHSLLDKDGDEADAMIHYYIGECYEKMEEFQNARLYYRKATSLNSEITDAWIGLGVCENELANPKAAIKYIKKGLGLDSENAAYHSILGDIYFQVGMMEQGKESYSKAVEITPEDETLRIDYAEALAEKGYFDDATDVLLKAIEHLGPLASLYYRMAAMLYLKGRSKDAEFFLEEALSTDFEKHIGFLEQFPELQNNKSVLMLIDAYSK